VVNKAFQINKQLYGNDLDVNEEAREVEKATAERLEKQTAKVEAFQTKTNARAEAAKKAALKNRNAIKAGAAAAAATAVRPSTAPADADSGVSRRLAIAAKKAADLALHTKPLVKKMRRSKKLRDSLRSSQAEAALAAAISKAASERDAEQARARAAARARMTAEKLAAARAMDNAAPAAPASKIRARAERVSLDKPLARRVAEKTTAPRPICSTFDIESTAIVQLSGLVGKDGTRYVGVDEGMATAFGALSAITPQMIKQVAAMIKPPAALLAVLEAVCVLVGEEPGWIMARKLLKRRDFIPALALSSVENIPFPRIRKLRSRGYLRSPLLDSERMAAISQLGSALLLWARAIDASAPPSSAGPSHPDSTSPVPASQDSHTISSTDAFARSLHEKRGYGQSPAQSPEAKSELARIIRLAKQQTGSGSGSAHEPSLPEGARAVQRARTEVESDGEGEGEGAVQSEVEIVSIDGDDEVSEDDAVGAGEEEEEEEEEEAGVGMGGRPTASVRVEDLKEFMAAMQTALKEPIFQ